MKTQTPEGLPLELKKAIPFFKEKHRHLFLVPILGNFYVVRALTWGEYKSTVSIGLEPIDAADRLVKATLLWPEFESLEREPAGIIDTLAASVLQVSGFTEVEGFMKGLEEARNYTQDLEHLVIIAICKAFPSYKPHELLDMSFPDLMEILTMAERMIGEEIKLETPGGSPKRQNRRSPAEMPVSPGYKAFGTAPPGFQDLDGDGVPVASREEILNPNLNPPDFNRDLADLAKVDSFRP